MTTLVEDGVQRRNYCVGHEIVERDGVLGIGPEQIELCRTTLGALPESPHFVEQQV
jgi:hypothetical protein